MIPLSHAIESAKLSMATFNAHDVKGFEREIETLATQVQVLGVCETWLRANDIHSAQLFSESVTVVQTHGGWRGQGGVALKVAPLIAYKVLQRHSQPEYQFITIKLGRTLITVLYLKPNVPKPIFLQCLNKIQAYCRGDSVIMGDFNARHSRWDSRSNSHGRWLVEWITLHGWSVHAPPEPTFAAHQGSSTVDLFLTKGVVTDGMRILSGVWDGSSDHRAVSTNIFSTPNYNLGIPRIPQNMRQNSSCLEKAASLYSVELPKFINEIPSCLTAEQLEDLYSRLKTITLQPWDSARKYRPKRYKYFWTGRLDNLKKMRSKAYRKAIQDKLPQDWAQYNSLNRQIRSLVRKNKRKCRHNLTEALASSSGRDGPKAIAAVLRTDPTSLHQTVPDTDVLDPSAFTKNESTPVEKGYTPPIVPFTMSRELERHIFTAILTANCNRASGTDELFSEAFKISPKSFARIFALLWVKCSQLGYLLHEWRTALLVPIYKRGPKSAPSSYRPIALLSHGRQTISKAIGAMIRKEYTFHPTQLGFREQAGTETAILRHAASTAQGFSHTAVLDLKGAYPSVPRDLLMETVHNKLSPSIASMIALELQPQTITTKGDITGATGQVTIGVPQGGSSSPALYNVYMDSFCELMESELQTARVEEMVDVSVFADDVKIRARTANGLQKGLDVCGKWAKCAKMTWSAPKCHVLEPESPSSSATQNNYFLSGEPLKVSNSAVYLGVTLRGTRLSTDRNIARVTAAFQRIGLLKAAGIHRKFVPSAKLVEICKTYVYPVADYGLHLMRLNNNGNCDLSRKLELLDYRVVDYAIGCIPKDPVQIQGRRIGGRLPRHLKLAKIPDWLQRVQMRLRSLEKRLRQRSHRKRADSLALQDPALFANFRTSNHSPRNMSKRDLRSIWSQLCRRCRRRIPVPDSGFLPILYEKDRHVREAGVKWYCGSFPGNPDQLQAQLGTDMYTRHKVRIQSGMHDSSWTSGTRRKTIESLQAFLMALRPDQTRKRHQVLDAATSASKRRRTL